MGGQGSGRRSLYNGKITTEDVCSFSVKQLASKGLFSGKSEAIVDLMRYHKPYDKILVHSWQICISPVCCSDTQNRFHIDLHDGIYIERTPCNFGSTRPWFLCPQCARRKGILFIVKIRGYKEIIGKIACRTCHKLPYASQLEGEFDRACRQVRITQRRLGNRQWQNDMEPLFPKPKGMHRKTYMNILARVENSFETSREGWAKRGMRISPIHQLIE